MSELSWCVIQDGYAVASGFGPRDRAISEMLHYAMVYEQDGPVQLKTRTAGSKWKIYDDADRRKQSPSSEGT
jgi:hypothetical protein